MESFGQKYSRQADEVYRFNQNVLRNYFLRSPPPPFPITHLPRFPEMVNSLHSYAQKSRVQNETATSCFLPSMIQARYRTLSRFPFHPTMANYHLQSGAPQHPFQTTISLTHKLCDNPSKNAPNKKVKHIKKLNKNTTSEKLNISICAKNVVDCKDDHKKIAHIKNELGAYLCRLCTQEFTNAFDLAKHRCPRILKVEYSCQDCEKVFNCPANLASHRRWHKPRTRALLSFAVDSSSEHDRQMPRTAAACSGKTKSFSIASILADSPTNIDQQNYNLEVEESPMKNSEYPIIKFKQNFEIPQILDSEKKCDQCCEVCGVKGLSKKLLEQHMLDHMMTTGLQTFVLNFSEIK